MNKTTIKDIVAKMDDISDNESLVVYAKRINGLFDSSSEALIIELSENEQEMLTRDIAEKHCPGFDYFLEVFIIKDLLNGLSAADPRASLQAKVDRIMYYAEYDA